MTLTASLLVALIPAAGAAERFLTLGDWGGAALGSYELATVYRVADAMANATSARPIDWLVNTGDNFYYCGLHNATDSQVSVDFDLPYGKIAGLDVPWFSVLGNHEYGWNVDSQIELSARSKRWVLPDRYWSRRMELGGGKAHASFLFLDSSPCVHDYRANDPHKWDPCNSMYPDCSPIGPVGEPCLFHEHILTQDCGAQYDWFLRMLAEVPADDFLIVVAHHPLDELNVRDFVSPLQARGFHLYLNGHVHTLNQYSLDGGRGGGIYVTSGAGAMLQTHDQESDAAAAKAAGRSFSSVPPPGVDGTRHEYETVWNQPVAGFTLHEFSDDYQSITTEFVSYQGETLRTVIVRKEDAFASGGKASAARTPAAAAM